MNRSAAAGARSSAYRPRPLTARTTTRPSAEPDQQRDGDRGALEDADPGAAAQDRRVLRTAGHPHGGGVGGAQDGGRDRSAARDRGEHARPPRRPRTVPAGASPAGPGQRAGEGEQDGEEQRAPGRAHPLPLDGEQQAQDGGEPEQHEDGDVHGGLILPRGSSSRAAVGRRSRSRSHSPAASRWPTACREMPSSAGGLRLRPARADQRDRLPRLVAAALDDDRERGQHRLGVAGVGGHDAADGQPRGPLLGGVDGPAGAEERRPRAGTGARRQRASAPGPAPTPMLQLAGRGPAAGPPRRRRPGSARTPWNSSPAVRSKPSTVGTAPFSRRSTSGTRSGLLRLARWSTVSTNGTRARLTAFIGRCKPQSLSTTSGGKPPVAIGPQPVIVIRSSDLPCRVIAARYSSQSGCSPLIER